MTGFCRRALVGEVLWFIYARQRIVAACTPELFDKLKVRG